MTSTNTSSKAKPESNEPLSQTLAPVPNVAYASTACFSCYQSPPQVAALKKCGGCKRIKFCSTECSTSEWSDHKAFCKAFTAVRSRTPQSTLPPSYPSNSDFTARLETHKAQWLLEDELMTVGLGREMTKLESLLLYREPRCGVCGDRECDNLVRGEGWVSCDDCRVAWFCESHAELGKEVHGTAVQADGRTQCRSYILSNEVDEFFLRHTSLTTKPPSLYIPLRLLPSITPLPTSWENYFKSTSLPKPTPTQAEVYGVFSESLSPILTILAALNQFRITPDSFNTKETLTLHILGATPTYEGSFLPTYEEILHQLPDVKILRVIFIGLEVPIELEAVARETEMACCPICTSLERKRTSTWRHGTYQDLVEELPTPDLIVAFSPGFSQEDWKESTWKESVETILEKKIPLVVTSNTKEDGMYDLSVLKKEAGAQVQWDLERNIWCGYPRVDRWEEGGAWRSNQWWFGIKGLA